MIKKLHFLTPFLIALSQVLFLWQHNEDQVITNGMLQITLLVSIPFVILGVLIFLAVRDYKKSILINIFITIIFFSYGHLIDFLLYNGLQLNKTILHSILIFNCVGLFLLTLVFIKKVNNLRPSIHFFFMTASIMVTFSTFNLVKKYYFKKHVSLENQITVNRGLNTQLGTPDVYYIILDGYCRQDVLKSSYDYDNSEFLSKLEERGFFISKKSTSNYPATHLSLSSTLNLNYHSKLGAKSTKDNYKLIHKNKVGNTFQSQGYKYITVNSCWTGTQTSEIADIQYATPFANEFLSVLLNNTIAKTIFPSFADMHRFSIDALLKASENSGPKFVFSHFILPHSPYVFDEYGNEIKVPKLIPSKEFEVGKDKSPEGLKAYIEQLKYTNKEILNIIDNILKKSQSEPIIIIQADHGWDTVRKSAKDPIYLHERYSILNAWLAPETIQNKLNHELSSVNTFRILFTHLFGANLPTLETKNYFSNYDKERTFKDVTQLVRMEKTISNIQKK